jgi:hypothetical protein
LQADGWGHCILHVSVECEDVGLIPGGVVAAKAKQLAFVLVASVDVHIEVPEDVYRRLWALTGARYLMVLTLNRQGKRIYQSQY